MPLKDLLSINGKATAVYDDLATVKAAPLTEERLAVLGHEIRNPLNALSFAIEALPSSKDEPRLLEDLIQVMQRQVSQLTRICDDLLDTGRITRGNLTLNCTGIEVGKLICHAWEQIQPYIERCGHTMSLELGDTPLTLLGDASRLTQVFANLMHNSAKFTDRRGQLLVSLRRERDSAVIVFRDNGRGMDADQLKALFTTNNVSKPCSDVSCSGLGIGLRLAKTIVELHGGLIEAFSEGLEFGSTFVVRIPIASDSVSDPVQCTEVLDSQAPQRAQLVRPLRTVVVDDDRSMRFLMSRLAVRPSMGSASETGALWPQLELSESCFR